MKTVFIRAIEAPADEKATVIREAVSSRTTARFDVDTMTLGQVPRSPFAYWASNSLLNAFSIFPLLSIAGFETVIGASTKNDFRYLRLAHEVLLDSIGISRSDSMIGKHWILFAKGGHFSPFYADIILVVNWGDDGRQLKADISEYRGSRGWGYQWSAALNGHGSYFRPGLTWPLRTQGGFSIRVMPEGCIFAHKGPSAFVEGDRSEALLTLSAITNSRPFAALVEMQMAFGSYEVGVIQRTPVPIPSYNDAELLAHLAHRSWSLKRLLDTQTENSHAFLIPVLLQTDGHDFASRAQQRARFLADAQEQLDALAVEIDEHAYRLYGISAEDRQRIEQGFGASSEAEGSTDDNDGDEPDEDADTTEADAAPLVASLLSWSVGIAFGRFDVRLATGERAAPPEPEPFDPLPVCSPGMLTGEDGLPLAAAPLGYPLTFPTDGIFVDDPGHPRDLVHAVRSVFDVVFEDANARWHEAAEILETPDLRVWLAGDFFEPHIKRYSKSRRKAPIYWQFATASGAYSVWLYIHRATSDTLFRVLNEFVEPKLEHEKAKLDEQTQEFGPNPSSSQRRELERQESFVGELQALKIEVARVAPLWKPNLDDGVILNFAPLWRLVPQNKAWQTECKKAWDRLQAGDYDWAHLAMHLWPERVVHKCMEDRSLAIAHGLEDVFWYEDDSETWQKSLVGAAEVHRIIQERSSPTVKAALKDLLSAQAPAAATGRRTAARAPAVRAAAPAPSPGAARSAAREAGAESAVDEATLAAVRGAIGKVVGGASKADVLEATGISEGEWNKVITALLERGEVTRTGQKRGTRYHSLGGPHA
jgi:hypothetical protein